VNFALSKGRARPWELDRWELAEKFGWTLEYIDSLPVTELHEYIMVQMGRAKARGK